MRLVRTLVRTLALVISITPITAGCGGDDGGTGEEPYDTFAACFDDHHNVESFDVIDSIKICCIDHPIGGQDPNVVCGETSGACQTFVDAELDDPTVTLGDIQTACDEYIVDRGQ